jgi:hypothetical protein
MPPKNSSRPPAKKRIGTGKTKLPVAASEIVARLGRQIDDRWPDLRRQLSSLVRVGREKVEDLYSSAAQTISEHKEAFQDRLAEKKALTRAANRDAKAPEAPAPSNPTPVRKGKSVKKGTVKGSSARQRSKRPPRSAPKPHS